MIGSAGQLGAWTFKSTEAEKTPDLRATRWLNARSHARVSPLNALGSGGSISSTRASLMPTIDLAASNAGSTTTSSGPSAEAKERLKKFAQRRENFGSFGVDTANSIADAFHRDTYVAGSFLRETEIRSSTLDVDAVEGWSLPPVAIAQAAPLMAPYVSVIWSLVEAQQLRKARALIGLIPDAPEYARLKNLLRVPVPSLSERKDFDRTPEYMWLAQNAKDHVGKWIAVSGDSLVAVADTLRELRREVKKVRPARVPLLHYVE